MSRISLVRTNQPIPNESELGAVRSFLFGVVDGAGKDDRSRWQKFWSKVKRLEAGRVVLEGRHEVLKTNDRVRQAYLGM